jgi:hypothetical protein
MKITIIVDPHSLDNSARIHRKTWMKIKKASATPDCFPDDHAIFVGPTFKPLYMLNLVEDMDEDVLSVSKGVKNSVYPNMDSLEV